jgi:hypothetical protein
LGAAYYILDIACHVALLKSSLQKGKFSFTHSMNVSTLQSIKPADVVKITANVLYTDSVSNLVFLEAKITHEQTKQLLMTASVTKSFRDSPPQD